MPNWKKIITSGSDAQLNSLHIATNLTASQALISSSNDQILTLIGSGSTNSPDIFTVDGNNGRLFTVSDDLSDSLFTVNTSVGIPVIEAFANSDVNIGKFPDYPLYVTASGTQTIATGSFTGSFTGDGSELTEIVGGLDGQVQYNSGSILQGASDLYYDNISDNVGIGTTSPSEKLHVSGRARITTIDNGTGDFTTISGTGVLTRRTPTQVRTDIGAGTGNGTVTSIATTNGITGGTITTSGTIQLDNTVVRTSGNQTIDGIKTFTDNILVNNSLLSNQQNTDVDTGTETVATVSSTDYDGAFFDYVIKNGTNLRAGTVTAVHDGTNVSFNEVSTQDIGDTTDIELSVDLSGGDIRLRATAASDNWLIKTIIRAL